MALICGCIKRIIKWTLYIVVFLTILAYIPNLPPHTNFTSIEIEEQMPWESNTLLNNGQQLHLNKINGPEAFALLDGEIYSGLATGELVKFSSGGHVTYVTKLGHPCEGVHQEDKCGRPLGIVADEKEKVLYVADAYQGIWKVNPKTDKKQLLVSPRTEIKGQKPKVFNGVAHAGNGNLYWTDTSSDFGLKDMFYGLLSDPSGRLFYYDAATNTSSVLAEGLWFPNGVLVSPDGRSVVVAETSRFRLLRHHVAGPRRGETEVLLAGLPGTPDNLRALPDGSGFLAALYTTHAPRDPLLLRAAAAAPRLRRALARLVRLVEMPFELALEYYPSVVLEEIVYFIGNLKPLGSLIPHTTGLLHVSWAGAVLGAYYNTDRTLRTVSDAAVLGGRLYLASPHAPYLGAVAAPEALRRAFEGPQAQAQKPQTTAQKPEVKTQKPEVKTTTQKPEVKTTTQKPEVKTTTQKPEVKTTTQKPPAAKPEKKRPEPVKKPAEPTKPAAPKPATAKDAKPPQAEAKPAQAKPADAKPKPAKTEKKEPEKGKVNEANKAREHIPIQEEIPSDTARPGKDRLKVITRDGPAEIRAP